MTEPQDQPMAPASSVPPHPAPPRSRRPLIIAVGAVAVVGVTLGVLALAGVFTGTFTLAGSIMVVDSGQSFSGIDSDGTHCHGTGPYSDLGPGTAVVVEDTTGKVLAVGALSEGTDTHEDSCVLPFAVQDVRDGEKAYSVTVSHRGTQVVSSSEAHTGVALTIGSD